MKACCTATKDLGCFNSCDDIQTGEAASQPGVHTIEVFSNGQKYSQDFTFAAGGEPLNFTNFFNEDAINVFQILQPDGTYLTTATGQDCFQAINTIVIST